jgi:hypothetical protein
VGSYTYVSKDPKSRATDHNLDHLILQSDGTYELGEGGTTKAVSTEKGAWKLMAGNPPTFSSIKRVTRLRSGEMKSASCLI